ncbi:AAA family ATPase [Falsiroseomonas sp.]|uniref:AAA family ATPase n=1 Tax=Falsiroseomonas sp. TaxID=2870721 RepID=UPI002719AB4C|nr:AAA family ATPase [Falsiroseomonas sp.]MDO9499006.1 AAA family ATPase [Falsiroseomonas sp.]
MPSDTPPTPDEKSLHEAERLPLATKLQSIRAEARLTWEEMGREVGMPHQTLQLWATGKYAGRVDRMNEQVSKYLTSRAQAQNLAMQSLVDPGFIITPTTDAFQALMRQAQYLPTMVACVGAPGIGKTMAAEDYAASNPNVFMVTALAGHPSCRWLLEELARVMKLTERGGSQRLASVVIQHLKARRALILIDEANHLAPITLDLLRGIHDQAKCGIALVGNARVIGRLEGARDADFAQLFRRIGGRLNRTKTTRADVEALLAGWGVTDPEVAKLLRAAAARPGALGIMTHVLRLGHMMAATQGQPLSASHIEQADAQLRGGEAA